MIPALVHLVEVKVQHRVVSVAAAALWDHMQVLHQSKVSVDWQEEVITSRLMCMYLTHFS